jgi:dsDNA-specific endonuclease/ATPase MutS2
MSELIERAREQLLAIKKRYGISQQLRQNDIRIIRRLEAFIRSQMVYLLQENITETNKRQT